MGREPIITMKRGRPVIAYEKEGHSLLMGRGTSHYWREGGTSQF